MAVNLGINIQRSQNRIAQALRSAAVDGSYPELLADFVDEYYRANGSKQTFDDLMTHSRNGNATMVDSDGLIKWAPHNLLSYSEDFSQWSLQASVNLTSGQSDPDGGSSATLYNLSASTSRAIDQSTTFSAATYTFAVWIKAVVDTDVKIRRLSDASGEIISITVAEGWQLITADFDMSAGSDSIGFFDTSGGTGDRFYIWGAHLYRSDLGGMVDNPDRGDSYVPTTSSARYLPRRGHHKYNGDAWVDKGVLVESEARTNLALYSIFDAGVPTGWYVGFSSGTFSHTLGTEIQGAPTITHQQTVAGRSYLFQSVGGLTVGQTYTVSTYIDTQNSYSDNSYPVFGILGLNTTYRDVTDARADGLIYATFTAIATTAEIRIGMGCFSNDTGQLVFAMPQLEAASAPSSHIPTSGASVTRAAETITVPYANLPWPTPTYIGDELVTNGDFSDGITGWSTTGSASISSSSGEGLISISSTSPNGVYTNQLTLTVGSVYVLTADVRVGTGSTIGLAVLNNDATSILATGETTTSTSTVSLSLVFVCTDQDSRAYVRCANSVGTYYVDNVSVREINPLSVSIAMDGEMTYADTNEYVASGLYAWAANPSSGNRILARVATDSTKVGSVLLGQESGGVFDYTLSSDVYTPDLNVPFNIASRHGSTFINGAVDGTALTADTTPVALPDLSTTNLSLAYDYMGTISSFRMWNSDLGDTGIATATTPSLEASLSLTFDGLPNSYTNTGLTV